jgi:hypothetical protein
MSDIAIGQLEILAEELSSILDTIDNLKEREKKIREEAFSLLKQTGEKTIRTEFGTFTNHNGKRSKVINCKNYNKMLAELEALKAMALAANKYKTAQGENYLVFNR